MTYELGSLLVVLGYVVWQIVKWLKFRGFKENQDTTESELMVKMEARMNSFDGKLDKYDRKLDKNSAENTHAHDMINQELKALNKAIHNGLSHKMQKCVDANEKQWKAINENTTGIAVLKAKQ